MNPEEFDTSLTDLETRVDRLRALYENWFRGYEKTEPSVARKDVERRVYALRKELPRNTALRFRYHQLFQRFTTLANYWQRTARQIEEGTHRLQLQRMRRRRPSEAPASLAPRDELTSDTPPPATYSLNLDESLDVQKLLDEAEFDHIAAALEGARPAPSQAPAQSPRAVGRFSRPSPSADAPSRPSLSLDLGQSVPPGAPRPSLPGLAATPSVLPPDASVPGAIPKPPRMPVAPLMPPPLKPSMPSLSMSPPTPDVRPAAVVPGRAPQPGGGASLPPTPSAAPRPPAPPIPSIPSRAPGTGTGTMPMPPTVGGRPPPPARSPQTGTVPMPPPPSPQRSMAPTPGAAPARPPAATPRPSMPGPPPARPAAAPAAPAPAQPGAISEQRMRRIYDEYAAARRKNNEGEVRFETLQGSIQKMLPELNKKHQGKQIDFEVVVKDGRVGLKPRAT